MARKKVNRIGKCYKVIFNDGELYYYVWGGNGKWCQATTVAMSPNTFQIDSHVTLEHNYSFKNKTEIPMSEFKEVLTKAIRGATNILNGI